MLLSLEAIWWYLCSRKQAGVFCFSTACCVFFSLLTRILVLGSFGLHSAHRTTRDMAKAVQDSKIENPLVPLFFEDDPQLFTEHAVTYLNRRNKVFMTFVPFRFLNLDAFDPPSK